MTELMILEGVDVEEKTVTASVDYTEYKGVSTKPLHIVDGVMITIEDGGFSIKHEQGVKVPNGQFFLATYSTVKPKDQYMAVDANGNTWSSVDGMQWKNNGILPNFTTSGDDFCIQSFSLTNGPAGVIAGSAANIYVNKDVTEWATETWAEYPPRGYPSTIFPVDTNPDPDTFVYGYGYLASHQTSNQMVVSTSLDPTTWERFGDELPVPENGAYYISAGYAQLNAGEEFGPPSLWALTNNGEGFATFGSQEIHECYFDGDINVGSDFLFACTVRATATAGGTFPLALTSDYRMLFCQDGVNWFTIGNFEEVWQGGLWKPCKCTVEGDTRVLITCTGGTGFIRTIPGNDGSETEFILFDSNGVFETVVDDGNYWVSIDRKTRTPYRMNKNTRQVEKGDPLPGDEPTGVKIDFVKALPAETE